MIEQSGEEIYVHSKLLDLKINSEKIIVTRLLSQFVYQPLIFFISDKQNSITICSPTNIKLIDKTVYFDINKITKGSITFINHESLSISFESKITDVGIMFPTDILPLYFGDEIKPIDKSYTCSRNYKYPTEDPLNQSLSIPLITLQGQNSCLTIETQNLQKIKFCHFLHDFVPYFNIITQDKLTLTFKSHNTLREGLSDFYSRFGYQEPLPIIAENITLSQMQYALFNNCNIISPKIESLTNIYKLAYQIQKRLGCKSCIIGSLALHIHGINVQVNDIDLVVDSLEYAKAAFVDHPIRIASKGKWENCSFRTQINGITVDFNEISSFDWSKIETINGNKVLNYESLLLMKLIGEFERSLLQPDYDEFKNKNYHNILLLLPNASFVYSFFQNYILLQKNFNTLKSFLKDAVWDSIKINSSFPILANVFKNDKTIIVLLNTGSPYPFKVSINKEINSALFIGLNLKKEKCKVINENSSWSILTGPPVDMVGLVVAE